MKLKPVLCDNLEEWVWVGVSREGTYVYLWLINVDYGRNQHNIEKQSNHNTVIILQLK